MPLYSYECDTCKLSFDRHKTVSDRFYSDCPECNEPCGKILSMPSMAIDSTLCDLNGTPVWYPKNGGEHYDKVLKQTFHSKKEKVQYMNKMQLVMDGSDAPSSWPIEAGAMRNKSYRKEQQTED